MLLGLKSDKAEWTVFEPTSRAKGETMSTLTIANLPDVIARMDRPRLRDVLSQLDCGFALDFTQEFLRSVSLARLRHIVLAAAQSAGNLEQLIAHGAFQDVGRTAGKRPHSVSA